MPLGRFPSCSRSSWPGMMPEAPLPIMWSIRLRPSCPLELASPVENSGVAEFIRTRADSSVEAQRKTTFA